MTTIKPEPHVFAAGEGLHLDMLGTLATFKVFTRDTKGAYCLFEGRIMPGESAPLHYHPDDDEGFYILAGHFRFRVGDEQFDALPGAYAFVPRNTMHGYQNIGGMPGRLLVMVSPGDRHEEHFLHYGRQIADPSAPLRPPAPEAIAQYLEAAPAYGIVLAPQRNDSSS